jgi:hypothetical protein
MNIESIANENVVERHRVRPSVFSGGRQHAIIRARQNLASLRPCKRPLVPSHLPKRHLSALVFLFPNLESLFSRSLVRAPI